MSKKQVQQRQQASTHYHDAARQHQESAHLGEAGDYQRAHHEETAGEERRQAAHHAGEAAKQTSTRRGSKK